MEDIPPPKNFDDLPKYLKENIFLEIDDLKELGRLRRVCKSWKNVIDNSENESLKRIEQRRIEYCEFNKDKEWREYRQKMHFSTDNPYFDDEDGTSCGCCIGELCYITNLGGGCTFLMCACICGTTDDDDCCSNVCAIPLGFATMICGLPLLIIGLFMEFFRCLAWAITIGYCNRQRYCRCYFYVYPTGYDGTNYLVNCWDGMCWGICCSCRGYGG
eukprot:TRINITY_DN4169_c0_g1_i2.p1 TRINITY_DN4169_c0_g1~~TRINITY_DN4169_c0_g1_i2.p1  ORF type:complete len:216 (-),score=46.66 TRINITY_DN4169_c0_g1_i2:87-734(-)